MDVGTEETVLHKLRAVEGVKGAHQVYGVYDIIVEVEDKSTDGVKGVLKEKIRRLDNVRNTLTLMVV